MMKDKSNSRKILAVMSAVWSFEGGIEKVNQSFLKFWEKNKSINEINLLILHDSQEIIEKKISEYGFKKVKAEGFSGNEKKFVFNFYKTWLKVRPNLIFYGHLQLLPIGIGPSLFESNNILFIHGIEVWRKPTLPQRIALDKCEIILANSTHTIKKASAFHKAYSRAKACNLGIPVPTSSATYIHENNIWWAGRQEKILCVGRMNANEGYKGQDKLIRAMALVKKRFPESILVLVGRGDDVNRLKKLVKDSGVEENVFFAGYVNDEELFLYYESCDVFAMPSKGEGFGIVYLEAMARMKPCIGSTMDAAGDIIIDGKTGFLVDPDNIEEIADRICEILSDDNLKMKMGEEGKKRFIENFTEEKFHERLLPYF